jgi:phenylacetate-CoA ligase
MFMPGFNKLRNFNSKARAYAEFIKAKRNVPGYKAFLASKNFNRPSFNGMIPNIEEIPYTDKENYVKVYSMDERCVGGKVPNTGVVIDESSGSSGTATNWARGKTEREKNARFIKFGMRNLFGEEPMFIINAFALGPWATGVNITMSCVTFSKLKSLGPDKTKIENTLKHFGKEHKYIVMGYPPFLKSLVDNSGIDWKEYNVSFIFGGESMSEGMRDYMINKGIRKAYSSLGASDLELNLSAENDFTISVRRLLRSNEALRHKVLRHTGALPMLFQFNPADFHFESSDIGELIITISRPDYIAPKIRYNIHDRGHVLQISELFAAMKEVGIAENEVLKPQTDLPILLHYGRADMTVSFFGANISPTDIQEVMYHFPILSNIVSSFCLNAIEDNEGNKQLVISFEVQPDKNTSGIDLEKLSIDFFLQLTIINQDFREAYKMVTRIEQTTLQFFESGKGPFVYNDIRIKSKYINQAG